MALYGGVIQWAYFSGVIQSLYSGLLYRVYYLNYIVVIYSPSFSLQDYRLSNLTTLPRFIQQVLLQWHFSKNEVNFYVWHYSPTTPVYTGNKKAPRFLRGTYLLYCIMIIFNAIFVYRSALFGTCQTYVKNQPVSVTPPL